MSNYKSLEDFRDKLDNNWKDNKNTILLLDYDDFSNLGKYISEFRNNSVQMSNLKKDIREMNKFADLTIFIDNQFNFLFKKQRYYFLDYNLNDLASELFEFFNSFRNKKIDLSQQEILLILIEIRRKNPNMIDRPINFLKYYNDLIKVKKI